MTQTPEVGMGVTYGTGSDSYAGTIQAVSPDGRAFWFTDDQATNLAVWPEQEWMLVSRPETDREKMVQVGRVSRGKLKGAWTIGGRATGTKIHLGFRRKHVDPHF